jgi:hypothetical protein
MNSKANQKAVETTPQQTENVRQWVTSPAGQNAIATSLKRAHVLAAQFREAERVDPESLRKPITL